MARVMEYRGRLFGLFDGGPPTGGPRAVAGDVDQALGHAVVEAGGEVGQREDGVGDGNLLRGGIVRLDIRVKVLQALLQNPSDVFLQGVKLAGDFFRPGGDHVDARPAAFDASGFDRTAPPLRFEGGSTDAGVNGTAGAGFAALQVVFRVTAARPGAFAVLGLLSTAAGREVASSRSTVTLAAGAGELTVLFPAARIHDAGVEGPLTAVVRVDAGGLAWNDPTLDSPMEASHTTGAYRSDQCATDEAVPGPKEPVLVEGVDSVEVRTGIMAAEVLREWPDIALFVAPDEGQRVYLRLLYTGLVAYADANGDGAPQPGEVAYEADLSGYNWQLGAVATSDENKPPTGKGATGFGVRLLVEYLRRPVN